jgi:hypothetical protein
MGTPAKGKRNDRGKGVRWGQVNRLLVTHVLNASIALSDRCLWAIILCARGVAQFG